MQVWRQAPAAHSVRLEDVVALRVEMGNQGDPDPVTRRFSSVEAVAAAAATAPENENGSDEAEIQAAGDGGQVGARGVEGRTGERSAEDRADADAGVQHPQQAPEPWRAEPLGDDG